MIGRAAGVATAVGTTELRIGIRAAAVVATAPCVEAITRVAFAGGDEVGTDVVKTVPCTAFGVLGTGLVIGFGAVAVALTAHGSSRTA